MSGVGQGSGATGLRSGKLLTAALVAAIGCALQYAYSGFLPVLTIPLMIGGIAALVTSSTSDAAATAGIGSLIGGSVMAWATSPVMLRGVIESLPEYARFDIPTVIFTDGLGTLPYWLAGQWETGHRGWVAAPIAIAALSALTALAIAWWIHGSATPPDLKKYVALVLVALISVSFLVTAVRKTESLRAFVAQEPEDFEYHFDALIYLKTYHLMVDGQDYYDAVVSAHETDSGHSQNGVIQDGKFTKIWPSPMYFRQPTSFQLWKAVAPDGQAGRVVILSIVLCAGVLGLSYWAFTEYVGTRAVFVPLFLYPLLMVHTTWENFLYADWWAGLCVLIALLLVVKRRIYWAVPFALLAALFRFVALAGLLVLLLIALVDLLSDRRKWRPVAAVSAALGVFALLYYGHLQSAAAYIDPETLRSSGVGADIVRVVGIPIERRLLGTTAYLMFPYGLMRWSPVVYQVTAVVGYWVSLSKARVARTAMVTYVLGWLVFMLTVGAASTYWGQMFTPILVIGTALLLVSLDYLVLDYGPRTWSSIRDNGILRSSRARTTVA